MIRTTLLLPPALHQRLILISRHRKKSFSNVARELFQRALASEENTNITRTYDALDTLDGRGKRGIADASTTIDELLYGEHGVWKGQSDE